MHMPGALRGAFRALFELDSAMGDVVARATEPALAAVKLAWWRERLEALDSEPPPAEPRLQSVATELLPRGVAGAELAALEPGWATLLDRQAESGLVAERGAILFRVGGRLLGSDDPRLGEAGALWALASVARRGVPELQVAAIGRAEKLAGYRFPRRVRALTGLARLASRDLGGAAIEPEGSPGRAAALLRHRWSGIAVLRG